MLVNVQATLEDLLEFFERHRHLTGQMNRAEAATFLEDSKCSEFRIQFCGRPRSDSTSPCGSTDCKCKGKGKAKGANIGDQEFDEVCRFGRTLTGFERRPVRAMCTPISLCLIKAGFDGCVCGRGSACDAELSAAVRICDVLPQ
eukprot:6631447-Pyramimonas_sp.AAC.1